ncbi:MAG: transcriptional regulator, TraR/DksA family protein [Nitrospirae bacterium]|nr:MAG: transcriptional regulator, TraR/DksA family protein [Nitrospirota bacterium]
MTAKSKPRQAVKAAAKTVEKAKAKAKAKTPAPKAAESPSTTKTAGSGQRKEALRMMLLERRQEVMKEIDGLIGHRMSDEIQRRVDSAPDVGDQALLDTERVRDISIMELRNKMRQQIDEALAKLEEGTYGRCADCGAEITEKRLRAVPFARRCVSCQEKQEMLEKIEMEEEQEL